MRRKASQLYPAALPRVISPLRGGYIRPSGGLCFAAVGGKVNVCRGSRHISINRTHSGSILLTITAVALPLQNVPARRAHLNFAPKGVQNITRGFAADITAPRARYNFSPQAKNITDSGFSPRRSLSRRRSEFNSKCGIVWSLESGVSTERHSYIRGFAAGYIAASRRLYPPFGRVMFCRRRRQS